MSTTEMRPWLANYPKGVPANIDIEAYSSILEYLDECYKKYPERIAYTCRGKSLTYKELDNQSQAMAGYLRMRGLQPGDRVALMTPNLLQFPIAAAGILRAGLILVNTNPLYTEREMEHQLTDSGAKGIIILDNFASKLQNILPKTQVETIVTTSVGELLGGVKGRVVDIMVKHVKRMVPKFEIENAVTFKEALKQGKGFKVPAFESKPDDVILFQYTGGTTGTSKGAMLTNRNMIANVLQFKAWIQPKLSDTAMINLNPLPMYHSFAFCVSMLCMPGIGAQTILIINAREIGTVIQAFKKYPVNIMAGVNTLFIALMNHKEFENIDFSPLCITVGGGMAVQTRVAEDWLKRTGCPLCEGYGLTESAPVAACNPLDGTDQTGSMGMPMPSTTIRVVDDSYQPVPQGQIGEIQIQGPQVMKGYHNDPEKTAETLREGWLCTGDIGLMQEDGFFKIVDRKKDMILVSGFNVYPNEIEDIVALLPGVLEVAAIGVPDGTGSEKVKVFIVKADKSLKEEEVIQHCRENLTNYKVPKLVEFRKELPKTNVGKILRRKLKEEVKSEPST